MKVLPFLILSIFLVCCRHTGSNVPGAQSLDTLASLHHKTIGCAGGTESDIYFLKANEKNIAKLISKNYGRAVAILDDEQMKIYHRFIGSLKATGVARGGCTTIEYYTLKIGDEIIKAEENFCTWSGFDTIKKAFFGNAWYYDFPDTIVLSRVPQIDKEPAFQVVYKGDTTLDRSGRQAIH